MVEVLFLTIWYYVLYVVRPFSICFMIIVRNIFAFCDVELEAQRKKDPSFCSEFSVIALCSRVIL